MKVTGQGKDDNSTVSTDISWWSALVWLLFNAAVVIYSSCPKG